MKCPVCKDVTLLMSEKKGIEIDYCPECRGIWLDRGELEKIIERSRQEDDYSSRNDYDKSRKSYDSKQPRKKRGSMLGDLIEMIGGGE